MRSILLTAALLLALVTLLAQPQVSAARRGGRRQRMQITCSQVKPQAICDGSNGGFEVSDGCNVCTCGDQPGKLTCSIKSCPREEELLDDGAKRRAGRYCAKLARKVQKRLRRFQAKAAAAAAKTGGGRAGSSGSEQRWPVKCFKERKLCRERPGVAFFDGCNRCRCPEQPPQPGTEAAAVCETANACPEFAGSRRQFKRHCRTLGASIDGGRRGGRGGRGGGRRRRQRQEGEGDSLFQRLLSHF